MDSQVYLLNSCLTCLNEDERHILYPRWGGIEAGATLSDHFRIMWESIEPGKKQRQLVHRCYVDSNNLKDHGCITRALDHAKGSIAFVKDYMSGELDNEYTEDQFLENLGMYLGVASHHIADICTPVHVGHSIDFRSLGFHTLARLHSQVERDILRLQKMAKINLHKPKLIKFSHDYFWKIATSTYENHFTLLSDIYRNKDQEGLLDMVSEILTSAVRNTTDVWHTVLAKSKMTKREWSMQPLL